VSPRSGVTLAMLAMVGGWLALRRTARERAT
jgi:hypothetical protein